MRFPTRSCACVVFTVFPTFPSPVTLRRIHLLILPHKRHRRELHVWHRARHPNVQPLCGVYLGLSNLPAMISPWAENGDINRFLKTRRTGLGSPENREIELSLVRVLYFHAPSSRSFGPSLSPSQVKDVFCGVEYCTSYPWASWLTFSLFAVHTHDPVIVHGDLKGVRPYAHTAPATILTGFPG